MGLCRAPFCQRKTKMNEISMSKILRYYWVQYNFFGLKRPLLKLGGSNFKRG